MYAGKGVEQGTQTWILARRTLTPSGYWPIAKQTHALWSVRSIILAFGSKTDGSKAILSLFAILNELTSDSTDMLVNKVHSLKPNLSQSQTN